ncbi:membrane dipeptidase [Thalassotalea psychrophila]|uniref:Membrane dipeptidase n=1 Tax=Thalassotalea psychrophila TaxID=3065647 RepID=A0ABY9TYS5_9GAMM|nr:membrane dipeptidase [Colwelliaceae bacterium SQ149]
MMKFNYNILTVALVVTATACATASSETTAKAEPVADTGPSAIEKAELSKRDYLTPPVNFEIKPRPKDKNEFPKFVDYLLEVMHPRSEAEMVGDAEMMAKYKGVHNIDSIVIAAPGFPADITMKQYEEYMEHFRENQFTSMSVTVSNGSDKSVEEVFDRIETFNKYISDNSDRYHQIKSVADFDIALKAGKLAQFYNFQSMNAFGGEISNIEKYYNLGLRTANFTYNQDNIWGGGTVSNEDGSNDGVTDLGKQAINEMNRVGMVVDCSHSSDQTCFDAASITSRPMIMSHSNNATLQPIGRNNSDKAMKAVAATGGAICINFIGGFLNPQGMARPMDIAKHIEYVGNISGREHVCAGSDFVYNYAGTLMWILNNPDAFPESMGYASPSHMGMPGEIWGVVRALEEIYGWNENEIKGLLGGNLIRVYKANWQ